MQNSENKKNPVMLLVDDDPIFCRLMTEVAKREKFHLVAYTSARLAYKEIEELEFDIAVLDYDLGIVTGGQLSQYMTRLNKHQPVVLISAGQIQRGNEWSKDVMAVESKSGGPYAVFSSVLRAFDKFNENKAKRVSP